LNNKENGVDNVTLTNSPEKEKELENIIRASLEKQRVQGIRIGMLAASKAVMEHLNDTSKPLLKRIEAIKKFCNVALKDEDKFLNQGINDIPTESEVEENE
jgi:hypothetical protein